MLDQSVTNVCNRYWAVVLGQPVSFFEGEELGFSSSGHFVERAPDQLFFYRDCFSGKRVFVSAERHLAALRARHHRESLETLGAKDSLKLGYVADRAVIYNDLDYLLPKRGSLRRVPTNLEIRALPATTQLAAFYDDCSEEDVETLDLDLAKDQALGIYVSAQLAGIARSYALPRSPELADVSVVVRRRYRGQGLASPLVSALVSKIDESGLIPRYRVGLGNLPSRAVAAKLGFVPARQITVWGPPDPTESGA